MKTPISRAHRWFIRWEPYLGLLLASGFFSWLGKKLKVFGELGWPEAIFIGVGVAALLAMALAVVLAGWRFFRPLGIGSQPQTAGAETYSPYDDTELRAETQQNIVKIESNFGGLKAAFDAHVEHISKVLSGFDRVRLEGLETLTRTVAIQAAEIVGMRQSLDERITSHDYAISAIGHRDILLRKAGVLETLGEELVLRDGVSLSDPKAWQSWQHALSEWEAAKQHWIIHALPYRPDVASLVDTVPETWYEQEWSVGLSEFPTIAALRKYQTWEGQLKNWQYARTTVDPLVFGVAFYGKRPIGAA